MLDALKPVPSASVFPVRRRLYGLLLLTLVAVFSSACNEITPKIINSGSSRPFNFETYFTKPLNPPVLATGGRLNDFTFSTQALNFYDLEAEVAATDTTSTLFNDIRNCGSLSLLHRRIPAWPWINDPGSVATVNNFAVYMAEKAYLRFFTNYCIGYSNFFNAQVEESTLTTGTFGTVYYLRSDNLSITDGTQTAVYDYLLSQSEEIEGIINLVFSIGQKAGQTDSRFFERLNYTSNKNFRTKRYSSMRLLVDNEYSGDRFPDFYHLESYTLERHITGNGDTTPYDLIKFRSSRYEKDSTADLHNQVVINAELIAHAVHGTYIAKAASCAMLHIEEPSGIIQEDCPDSDIDQQNFFLSDSAQFDWFTNNGVESEEEYFDPDNKAVLLNLSSELERINLQWFDFSTDSLTEVFQHGDPARILTSNQE